MTEALERKNLFTLYGQDNSEKQLNTISTPSQSVWDSGVHQYQVMNMFYDMAPREFDSKFIEKMCQQSTEKRLEQQLSILASGRFIRDMFGSTKINGFNFIECLDVVERVTSYYKQMCCYPVPSDKQSRHDFEKIVNEFESTPCVLFQRREELIHQMTRYGHFTGKNGLDRCRQLLNLMSENLKGFGINTFFTKFKDGLLVAPHLFPKNNRFALFNRFLKKSGGSRASTCMEKTIGKLFSDNGYKVAMNYSFFENNQKQGEPDCLAYKDGCLFIIEAKQTHFRSNKVKIMSHKKYLSFKGAKQLARASQLVKEHFEETRKKLDIQMPFEKLKICPILVSTSQFFDSYEFHPCRKISLFDLHCLLNPDYYCLLQRVIMKYPGSPQKLTTTMQQTTYQQSFLAGRIASSPEVFLKAVDENWLWEELEANLPTWKDVGMIQHI